MNRRKSAADLQFGRIARLPTESRQHSGHAKFLHLPGEETGSFNAFACSCVSRVSRFHLRSLG
jgi:hypothetical protein